MTKKEQVMIKLKPMKHMSKETKMLECRAANRFDFKQEEKPTTIIALEPIKGSRHQAANISFEIEVEKPKQGVNVSGGLSIEVMIGEEKRTFVYRGINAADYPMKIPFETTESFSYKDGPVSVLVGTKGHTVWVSKVSVIQTDNQYKSQQQAGLSSGGYVETD
jgi:hypothetical protein